MVQTERNFSRESTVVTVSYLVHQETLLQNTTDINLKCDSSFIIAKCDSPFITKCGKSFLQNSSGILLQKVIGITKCDDFMTNTNVTISLQNAMFITKCIGT